MISNPKSTIVILIFLGIVSIFSPIYINNSIIISRHHKIAFNYNDEFDHENVKISIPLGKIHIDNNWTATKAEGICTGNGTYSNPYIIEDLVIDGDSSVSCIWIENSEAFFKIENCSTFNSFIGIRLEYTKNGQILNNTCTSSSFSAINLHHSTNNSISGNSVNGNHNLGISLFSSDKNNITKNIEMDNSDHGIYLSESNNNLIIKNIINSGISLDGINNILSANSLHRCGLRIYPGNTNNFYSQNIDSSNLVNGKPLYYYTNEINLSPINFTNAGQVILASCDNSLIKNLNLSYSDTGITLINCGDNIIKGNTMNNNRYYGMYMFGGGSHNISQNSFSYNKWNGIHLEHISNSIFSGNNVSYNYHGIYCHHLENSIISENNINHNKKYGIDLFYCTNNKIMGNHLIGNEKCINQDALSEGNILENNECRDRPLSIPGYKLHLLLGILFALVIIFGKKVKKSRRF